MDEDELLAQTRIAAEKAKSRTLEYALSLDRESKVELLSKLVRQSAEELIVTVGYGPNFVLMYYNQHLRDRFTESLESGNMSELIMVISDTVDYLSDPTGAIEDALRSGDGNFELFLKSSAAMTLTVFSAYGVIDAFALEASVDGEDLF